jgi:hypothetical protein
VATILFYILLTCFILQHEKKLFAGKDLSGVSKTIFMEKEMEKQLG